MEDYWPLCDHPVTTRDLQYCAMIIGMQIAGYCVSAFLASGVVSASLPAHADSPGQPAPRNAAGSAPTNQIWECTTKGVRTFSNNPCGTKPTVRELNPINVMEPVPVYLKTHAAIAPAATPSGANYADGNQDAAQADNAYNPSPGYMVVTRVHRQRANSPRNHPHPHR